MPSGVTGGDTRPAADVDDEVAGSELRELGREPGVAVAADGHGRRRQESGQAGEGGVVVVVVGDCDVSGHGVDLDT